MLGLPSIGRQCKVYCLPALMYGCESWHLQNKEQNRISVAWNNCFRSIFNCCWRESVNPLQSSAYKLLTNENFCIGTSCPLLIIMCYFLRHVWYHKDLLQLNVCMVCRRFTHTANNKAGCMGHILQHSRVMSHVFYQFCYFGLRVGSGAV